MRTGDAEHRGSAAPPRRKRAHGCTVPEAVSVDRLTDEDARILARERGPVRGHFAKVLILDGAHDADALRAHVEPRIASLPRLRDRLGEAPLGRAPPAWVPDESFELDRHVRDGGRAKDHAALERAVAALMEDPLDRDMPLWSIDAIALAEGRTAVVLRMHHCMADGTTAMRIVGKLLLDEDTEGPRPAPTEGPPPQALGAVDPAERRKRRAAIRRQLAPEGRLSPLARRAGPHRTVAFSSFPLDDVKAIGHSAPERATVNDVVLAVVGGGLRRWFAHLGAEPHELRVKVPVSLHRLGEGDVANRDSFMIVDLPLDEPDPVARLLAITAETRERKAAHAADALDAFFHDLNRFSHSLERLADRWAMSPRVFALNVSNVPGPQGKPTVMGSPLLAMHFIAEVAQHHLLRVAIGSAAGRLSFGLCADADAVERLDLVTDGIAEELRSLQAAVLV
jgi:diacylglycerol O-acyltransferase